MYTQFFGNYLLNEKLITPEQLIDVMGSKKNTKIKLGLLAMNEGLMNSAQVEEVHAIQTRQDKRFGDAAIELGYLTKDQVDMLLSKQTPGYLLLGQAIIDKRYMRHHDFEKALRDYNKKNSLTLEDATTDDLVKTSKLIDTLYDFNSIKNGSYYRDYIYLLINNLIRFIGSDFTPLKPELYDTSSSYKFVSQNINGKLSLSTAIFSGKEALIPFSYRYIQENLEDYDEYVIASFQDFLNLHNGIFIVNMSNERELELKLSPPVAVSDLNSQMESYIIFPFRYTFGTIKFSLSL